MSGQVRRCGNCGNAVEVPLERVIQCHGAPPAVVPAAQQTSLGPQAVMVSVWPHVREDWSCGQWVERPVQIQAPDRVKTGGNADGKAN